MTWPETLSVARLAGTWSQLAHGLVYLVAVDGDPVAERPTDDDPEAILRVWTRPEEALAEAAEQRENYGTGDRTVILSCGLERLYELRQQIVARYGIPVRVEVCQKYEGETVVLEELFSPAAETGMDA